MSRWMIGCQTVRQQSDRQTDSGKQITPLESDTGQVAEQPGTHGFSTITWKLSLPWDSLILLVKFSTSWTRPTYTTPSPASSRIHQVAGNFAGSLQFHQALQSHAMLAQCMPQLQLSSSWLLTLQDAFEEGLL